MIDSDRILGSEENVERFVKLACDRLNLSLTEKKQGWLLPEIPSFLKPALGDKPRLLTFTTPAPEGVEYVGRNHPLVEGLASYILEEALSNIKEPVAAWCGFTITDAVQKRTTFEQYEEYTPEKLELADGYYGYGGQDQTGFGVSCSYQSRVTQSYSSHWLSTLDRNPVSLRN